MSYSKQTWQDGTTPVNASHMNHIEDGISGVDSDVSAEATARENADDGLQEQIDELNDSLGDLTNGTAKHYEIPVVNRLPVGTYEILWKEGTSNLDYYASALISCKAYAANSYADLIVNTYGVATSRTKVTVFQSGSNFSYEVDTENTGLILNLSGTAAWVIGITPMLGEMPTIVDLND